MQYEQVSKDKRMNLPALVDTGMGLERMEAYYKELMTTMKQIILKLIQSTSDIVKKPDKNNLSSFSYCRPSKS